VVDDHLNNAIDVFQNIIVPEAKNGPALPPQEAVAALVQGRLAVLPAIGLDGQTDRDAGEVYNVRRNWMLPAEIATQLPAAQS
jgi:hypothetical protein